MFVILLLNLIVVAMGFCLTKNKIKITAIRIMFWLLVFVVLCVVEYMVLS
jgi:hypothetical protein